MSKKLYAMTDTRQNTITRVLQSHYRKYPCDIYREAINELVPLDRQAAVERMARALAESLYGGDFWDDYEDDGITLAVDREGFRSDARAAFDALLQEGNE